MFREGHIFKVGGYVYLIYSIWSDDILLFAIKFRGVNKGGRGAIAPLPAPQDFARIEGPSVLESYWHPW